MKKFALFCGVALSIGFAACDDQLPNPPATEYPQPEIFDAAKLTLSQASYGVNEAIDLNKFAEEGESTPVLEITELTDFPADYQLVLPMEVGSDENFTKVSTVSTTIVDNIVYATPGALTDAIREVVSKSPDVQTVNVRFPAYAVNGQSTMVLGGIDHYFYTGQYKVKPYQTYVVENEYFLVGNFCDWDLNKGMKFKAAAEGNAIYDDPTFTLKFDVSAEQAAAGFLYKVVPASAVAAGNWTGAMGLEPTITIDEEGVENVEMYGQLIDAPAAETEAGVISNAGPYLLTLDMEKKTYDLKIAIDQLYVMGPGTSTTNFAKSMLLTSDNYIEYKGMANLRREWWMTTEENRTTLAYMWNDKVENEVKEGVTSGEIASVENSNAGKRIPITTEGLHWLQVNLVKLTYKATLINRVSLVGAFNGWDAAKAFDLTADANHTVWTGTLELEGEFKVNTNGAWDIDFGSNSAEIGSANKLDYKGANINVPAAKYEVKVDFSKQPYTITLNKK